MVKAPNRKPRKGKTTSSTIEARLDAAFDVEGIRSEQSGSLQQMSREDSRDGEIQSLDSSNLQTTVQYLRSQSPLLDLVTLQLAQNLVTVYRARLTEQMPPGYELTDASLPYFEVIIDQSENSPKLKTNLDSEVVLGNVKDVAKQIFDTRQLWEEGAREIWSNLLVWAVEEMQRETDKATASLSPEALNAQLRHYLFDQDSVKVRQRISRLEEFYSQTVTEQILHDLDLPNYPLLSLEGLLGLRTSEIEKPIPPTEVKLSQMDTIAAIPTGLPIIISISAQLQTELWKPDASGIAYFF